MAVLAYTIVPFAQCALVWMINRTWRLKNMLTLWSKKTQLSFWANPVSIHADTLRYWRDVRADRRLYALPLYWYGSYSIYCKSFEVEEFRVFRAWYCYRDTFTPEMVLFNYTCKCNCNTAKPFPWYENTQVIREIPPSEHSHFTVAFAVGFSHARPVSNHEIFPANKNSQWPDVYFYRLLVCKASRDFTIHKINYPSALSKDQQTRRPNLVKQLKREFKDTQSDHDAE